MKMQTLMIAVLGLTLAGCQANTLGGAALGGLGGAYGGSLIGKGKGKLAATAAGALLGAGTGGYLGSFLDQSNSNAAAIQQLQQQGNSRVAPTYYAPPPAVYQAPTPVQQPTYQQHSIPMNCQVINNYVRCNGR